jgi:hypothetical protein
MLSSKCACPVPLLEAPVSKIEGLGADVIDNNETVVDTVKQLSSGDDDDELPVDDGGSGGFLWTGVNSVMLYPDAFVISS